MYRLDAVQPCRTNGVLIFVKVILYGSIFNTLLIFISYETSGDDKTYILKTRVKLLRDQKRDPLQHHISGLQDPSSVPLSP